MGAVPEETSGPFGPIFAMDQPASSARTRDVLGCHPTHPSLLEDLETSSPEPGGHADAGQHARRAVKVLPGRGTRLPLLSASLLADLVIALLTVHLTENWEQYFG